MTDIALTELAEIPNGLFETEADALHALLGGPTLIHIRGKSEPALFVSVLLHGNETTGWAAVCKLLRSAPTLARSLSIFIGNTEAAARRDRRLDHQQDYNRCWPGTQLSDSAEARMAREVVDIMRQRGIFASIDIHNNTGSNPIYACTNRLDANFLAVAGLFSDTVVYFTLPKGVQSAAFAPHCPSVVLECGTVENCEGIRRAEHFIQTMLNLASLPQDFPDTLSVYHTIARVEVSEDIEMGPGSNTDFRLPHNLEALNFVRLAEGTCFGYVRNQQRIPVTVTDSDGFELTSRYFHVAGNELLLRKSLTPAMISTNVDAIRRDCLCYLMETLPLSTGSAQRTL